MKSCFRDPLSMHTSVLGTAKEGLASCLGYHSRKSLLSGPNLQEQLREISAKHKIYNIIYIYTYVIMCIHIAMQLDFAVPSTLS